MDQCSNIKECRFFLATGNNEQELIILNKIFIFSQYTIHVVSLQAFKNMELNTFVLLFSGLSSG